MDIKRFFLWLISLTVFLFIGLSNINAWVKLVLLLLLSAVFTNYMRKSKDFQGEYVFLLYRINAAIKIIEKVAQTLKPFLFYLIDTFLITSFGLYGAWWLYKNKKEQIPSLGIKTILGLILLIILAFISVFSFSTLQTYSQLSGKPKSPSIASQIVLILLGLYGGITLSLITSATSTLFNILSNVKESPSVTVLIPGINLPLVEGLVALGIIVFFHELMHGVSAILSGIRVKSGGLVLFGPLPIGGFVEPEEKELERAKPLDRARVIAAGISGNFVLSILFFLLLFVFHNLSISYAYSSCVVIKGNSLIKEGTEIYSINGKEGCPIPLPKNSTVLLETSKGNISARTNENGLLGIIVKINDKRSPFTAKYSVPWISFLRDILLLTFSLNLLVGLMNLLSIPLLDGHHLSRDLFSKPIFLALSLLSTLSLLILVAPYFL